MTKVKRQEGGAVMFTDGPLSRRKRTRVLQEKSSKQWKGKKMEIVRTLVTRHALRVDMRNQLFFRTVKLSFYCK